VATNGRHLPGRLLGVSWRPTVATYRGGLLGVAWRPTVATYRVGCSLVESVPKRLPVAVIGPLTH